MTTIFEKSYAGHSLCSIEGDVDMALNGAFNATLASIPKDDLDILKGTFIVKIEWKPEGE